MPKSQTIEQIEQMEKILAKQKENEFQLKYKGKKVQGFKLSKGSTLAANGKSYVVWRAHACKDGKPIVIHVGVDPRRAEKKIKAYLEKHPDKRVKK